MSIPLNMSFAIQCNVLPMELSGMLLRCHVLVGSMLYILAKRVIQQGGNLAPLLT